MGRLLRVESGARSGLQNRPLTPALRREAPIRDGRFLQTGASRKSHRDCPGDGSPPRRVRTVSRIAADVRDDKGFRFLPPINRSAACDRS